jgi:hypothetical protein
MVFTRCGVCDPPSQAVLLPAAVAYSWEPPPEFRACPTGCGEAQQTLSRAVVCGGNDGRSAEEKFCGGLQPATTLTCDATTACGAAHPDACAATRVPNSDKYAPKSIVGKAGDSVRVSCDEGYTASGSGAAVCTNGTFTVRAAHGRLSAIRVFLWKSILYGAFVVACRVLNSPTRRFSARAGSNVHRCRGRLVSCRRAGVLSLSDYASVLLFIWRFVWGSYERAHIIRCFPPGKRCGPVHLHHDLRMLRHRAGARQGHVVAGGLGGHRGARRGICSACRPGLRIGLAPTVWGSQVSG